MFTLSMKFSKSPDILLNILLPLLLGVFIYKTGTILFIPMPVRNHLPDGFWAYAFISSILIIWNREINIAWITIVFIISTCFELLQYQHKIPGTGDIADIIVYFVFFTLALLLNPFFKTLIFTQTSNP